MSSKTVFLVIPEGVSARFLLRSEFFDELHSLGAKIVLLAPCAEEETFVREFERDGVCFETYRVNLYEANGRAKLKMFFKLMRLYSFKKGFKNNFTEYWREHHFQKRKEGPLLSIIQSAIFRVAIYLNCHMEWFAALTRKVEAKLYPAVHQEIYEKYQPDLTIVTSLGMMPYDHVIMKEAHDNGSEVMSIILSWDNTTTKGVAGTKADYVVAWTETMRQELTKYHDVPEGRVFVGGVPQYDAYFNNSSPHTKSEVYKRFGLDPNKKTIFYCLESPTAYKWNPTLLRLMGELVRENKLSMDCQIVARLHPLYYRRKDGELVFKNEIDELNDIQKDYPFIALDCPETISKVMSFDMPKSEVFKLVQLLDISDIVVCFYSSLMIEASIFDVPIVNVSIYHKNELPNEVMGNHAHNKRVQSTLGVRIVNDEPQLIEQINKYLLDPTLDAEARRRIVENECGPNRGYAGKTIARHVMQILTGVEPTVAIPRSEPQRASA